MRKYFCPIGTAVVFAFGLLIYYSYILSGGAAWSLLISRVNYSAWDALKPFALAYIMWIVAELSILRLSLLRFICCKISALYLFSVSTAAYYTLLNLFPDYYFSEYIILAGIFFALLFAQLLSYRLYDSNVKIELFKIPLMVAFVLFLLLIIFFTAYNLSAAG